MDDQQQMIPAVEPVRRMTETERLLMNELMYAQAAAVAAQDQLATLKAAYQQQAQELTTLQDEAAALRVQIKDLDTVVDENMAVIRDQVDRIQELEDHHCPVAEGDAIPSDEPDQATTLTNILAEVAPPYPMPVTNIHEPRRPTTAYA